MKFEEVLPFLREGKAIRRRNVIWLGYIGHYLLIRDQLYDLYENWVEEIDVSDLLADDWEIEEEQRNAL